MVYFNYSYEKIQFKNNTVFTYLFVNCGRLYTKETPIANGTIGKLTYELGFDVTLTINGKGAMLNTGLLLTGNIFAAMIKIGVKPLRGFYLLKK